MHSSRAARLAAVAALVILGASALLPARYAVLVCRFGGMKHLTARTACCPTAARTPETPAGLAAATCCSLRDVHLVQAPVERGLGGDPPVDHGQPALHEPRLLAWHPTAPPPRRSPPLSVGPPLIVAKQSFLI